MMIFHYHGYTRERIPNKLALPRMLYLTCVVAIGLLGCLCRGQNSSDTKKKILAFGGNGMIGSEVLMRLINDGSYDITLSARGTWPFDTAEKVRPHVRVVECDREGEDTENALHREGEDTENALRLCDDLMEDIERTEHYYAVLDFSAFDSKWIEDAVEVLSGKVRVYVYMSSDSVYEVAEGYAEAAASNAAGVATKSLESHARRPENEDLKEELNEMDEYGHEKLACEEVLENQRQQDGGGFPYVSLRFADVIGPRDQTSRWAPYHLWLKFYQDIGIPIPVPEKSAHMLSSITYVGDAAASIVLAMERPESWDQAYNIACEEEFNLRSGLLRIAKLMGILGNEVKLQILPDVVSFLGLYPSINRGPMDITKAREKLNFTPTPLDVALQRTIEWYEDLFLNDPEERAIMLREIEDEILEHVDEDGSARVRLHKAVGQIIDVTDSPEL